jgi:hypothetical protein
MLEELPIWIFGRRANGLVWGSAEGGSLIQGFLM